MASRIAEIYRSEKSSGGGLTSAVGKRLKEKIDPRKMLDQKGLLVSMFPSLKAYNATAGKATTPKISGGVDSGVDNAALSSIAATSSLTAKNTMSLPMMARDMNLMKLNIFKLVKLQGGTANTNKTDIFWKNAKDRETAYESALGKMGGGMIGKMAKSSLTGRQKRDGQSSDSALFVTGGKGGRVQASEVAEGILTAGVLKKIMTSTVGFMTSSVGLSILGVAAGGVAIAGLARKLQDEQIDKAAERGDVKEVKQQLKNQALGPEGDLYLSPEDHVSMDKALNEISEDRVNKVKKPTKLEIEAQAASERLKNLPDTGAGGGRGFVNPTMPTGAGGGRGFVNPELVTPEAEAIPSNVVRTASGEAIRSGSGGYVTSGTPTPSPVPATSMSFGAIAGSQATSPTKDVSTPSNTGPNGEFKSKDDFLRTMYPLAVDASKQLGGVDPNALLTQWGFESAWGSKTSGKYNYFGIKADESWTGDKKDVMTHEFLDGQKVKLPQPFRSYNSPKEAVDDYVNFLKSNKRYKKAGVFQTKTSGEYFEALQKAGYATDPNYAAKLTSATEGTARKTASLQPSKPSTGTVVASASTSVSDQRMAAMTPTSGNTVINNKPTTVASASPSSGGKTASTYDNELFQTLVGYQSVSS